MNKTGFSGIIARCYGEAETWVKGLRNIIFPNVCTVCMRTLVAGENVICLHCLMELPRTNLHQYENNSIHERLMALGLPVEKATSLYYYIRESPFVRLIHDSKYRNRPSVGRYMASIHAKELNRNGFFDDIDFIVPVPLHRLKRITRGYNQSEEIAKGISSVTTIPVENVLTASYHSTQTRKDANQRLKNVMNVYKVDDDMIEILENRHVLLLDDVITTGATLLSCMQAIKNVSPTTKISIYSLGLTKLE